MPRSPAARNLTILTLVLALSEATFAKGSTTRLVISGPGLPRPIETTDPEALANLWGGSFIGEPASEPDESLSRYAVTFYVRPPREAFSRAMYVVYYVRDPGSGRGFVHLPGRGEEGWAMNVRTILRDGQDGRWHQASAGWNDAVASALSRR